jgi:hypothetical protein
MFVETHEPPIGNKKSTTSPPLSISSEGQTLISRSMTLELKWRCAVGSEKNECLFQEENKKTINDKMEYFHFENKRTKYKAS